jgi:hypothetical protein
MSRRSWRGTSIRAVTVMMTITAVLTATRAICLRDGISDGVLLVRSQIVEIDTVQKAVINDMPHDFIFHIAQVHVGLAQERAYTGLMRESVDLSRTRRVITTVSAVCLPLLSSSSRATSKAYVVETQLARLGQHLLFFLVLVCRYLT